MGTETIGNEQAIEFLAQMINDSVSRKEGYASSARWGCLREDLKLKYLELAKSEVKQWADEEAKAKSDREKNMELAMRGES